MSSSSRLFRGLKIAAIVTGVLLLVVASLPLLAAFALLLRPLAVLLLVGGVIGLLVSPRMRHWLSESLRLVPREVGWVAEGRTLYWLGRLKERQRDRAAGTTRDPGSWANDIITMIVAVVAGYVFALYMHRVLIGVAPFG